jgi:hypothetical protein
VLRLLALFCSRNLPDRRKRIVKNDTHLYEVRPRKDHRGHDLISDALPFGRLWYGEPDAVSNAIDYVKFFSRLHDAVIRVYDAAGNVIETQQAPYPGFTLVFGRRQVGTHHFHRLLARFLNELTFRHIARNHCRGGLN